VGCGHGGFSCQQACLYLVGKEVVSQFNTSIATAGGLITDSNGREMLVRQRNYRPLWNLTQTEQVAGNYFPVNSAAAIRDSQSQLTLLVDSSHGVASVFDGSMEVMIHRRLIYDDSRGVGEPHNETQKTWSYSSDMPGAHDGPGLVVRGTHFLSLEPPASAAKVWRPLQERLFAQPQPWFNPSAAPEVTSLSVLLNPLPPNVQLMTLQTLDPSTNVLLRLAHLFGLGEDVTLSLPVQIDLNSLFQPRYLRVLAVKEVSLTNNQDKAALLKRRASAAKWNTDGDVPHWWRVLPALSFTNNTVVTLGPLEIKSFVLTVEN